MTGAANEHKVNKMMLKINAPKLVVDGKKWHDLFKGKIKYSCPHKSME